MANAEIVEGVDACKDAIMCSFEEFIGPTCLVNSQAPLNAVRRVNASFVAQTRRLGFGFLQGAGGISS